MRSRILALAILILFIGVPTLVYWYFFHQNKSSLIFSAQESGIDFEVTLAGKLEYQYFPLADQALTFRQKCHESCTLILPPVKYSLVLTASGKEDILDVISLTLGEDRHYQADFSKVFAYKRIPGFQSDPSLESGLLRNANATFSGDFSPIGTTAGGKYAVLHTEGTLNELGIITIDRFVSLSTLPYHPQSVSLDLSRQYIIIDRGTLDRSIVSLDGQKSVIFPFDATIKIVDATNNWKVSVDSGVYTFEQGKWKIDPGFTDFLDLNSEWRVGYIDASGSEKLSSQNLPEKISIMVLQNRSTGTVKKLKSGINIQGFFMYNGQPAFIENDGSIGILQL